MGESQKHSHNLRAYVSNYDTSYVNIQDSGVGWVFFCFGNAAVTLCNRLCLSHQVTYYLLFEEPLSVIINIFLLLLRTKVSSFIGLSSYQVKIPVDSL